MGLLKTVLGLIGNVTAIMLFLSPLKTFQEIWKRKATDDFSPFPYEATLANCVLWVFYGLIKGHSPLVLSINGFGCAIELIYITFYLVFSNNNQRLRVLGVLSALLSATVAIIGGVLGGTHSRHVRLLVVGIICATLNAVMNLAPLSIMGTVIKTKSVEYMPFLLSLFVFINSVIWFFYALVTKDVYIMTPNVLGLGFGLAQLLLYAIYKKRTTVTSGKTNDLELGKIPKVPNDPSIVSSKPQIIADP